MADLFINQFAKGSSENANMGTGIMLGIDNSSVKGVARLSKDSTKVSASVVTDLPVYTANFTASVLFQQGDTGKVYKSTDAGTTWTDITNTAGYSVGLGKGLVLFDNVLYAFRGSQIEYCVSPFGVANWSGAAFQTGLTGDTNTPFIYPNARGFYFGNGFKLGILRQQTAGTPINPASPGTYFYSNSIFQLPSIYEITALSFLSLNQLVMGTKSSGIGNDPLIADIITWDTISLNQFGAPLRLYSKAGSGAAGVAQLINRNNTLYAVTAGNGVVYETNGTSFSEIVDFSLYVTPRLLTNTGVQATAPIFLTPRTSAIAVQGSKLYVAFSPSINSVPSGYGLFPLGVWSINFASDKSIQCEFSLSTGTICASGSFAIGSLLPIAQGQLLIGWNDGVNYGIDKTDFTTFQNDANVVWIESEMMEVGTPLMPTVIPSVEVNVPRSLIADQEISVYARIGFDQPYALLQTFTVADGNSLKITKNSIGQTKFLQLRVSMKTGGSNLAWSPEIRNVMISKS